ncbi:MAG: hypothetical protein AABP62_02250 [Planctomycetota bacterium]
MSHCAPRKFLSLISLATRLVVATGLLLVWGLCGLDNASAQPPVPGQDRNFNLTIGPFPRKEN